MEPLARTVTNVHNAFTIGHGAAATEPGMTKEFKLAFFGMVCATMGWWMGAYPPGGLDGTLARARLHRRQLLKLAFMNMENQFTPGYKAAQTAFDFDETPRYQLRMTQGDIFRTQCPTNLAIDGPGFFVLEGNRYTRDGRFSWQDGCLRSAGGLAVQGRKGPLRPGAYGSHRFGEQGQLYGERPLTDPVTGHTLTCSEPLDQVAVVSFANPELLSHQSPVVLVANSASGPPRSLPNALIAPGSLELSNVDFYQEGLNIGRLKGGSDLPLPAQSYMPPPQRLLAPALPDPLALKPGQDPLALPPLKSMGILGNGGRLPASPSR